MTRTRINISEWTVTPIKGRIYEVCTRGTEVVVLGQPESEDEQHNCDANGCGQDHVLWRSRLTALEAVLDDKEQP